MFQRLKLYFPLAESYKISQKFGENLLNYKQFGLIAHQGFDIYQTPRFVYSATFNIYAAHDGEVVHIERDPKLGIGITIRTNEQYLADLSNESYFFKTRYWHLQQGGVLVQIGQQVKTGDLIAYADNTGYSTGTHLHWDLKPIKIVGEVDTEEEKLALSDYEFTNVFGDNGYRGAVNPEPYLEKRNNGSYYTALQVKNDLKKVEEEIIKTKSLLEKVVEWFKRMGKL